MIIYAETMLKEFNEEGNFPITPTLGSMIIGLTSVVGTVFSFFMVKYFGRRTLLVSGQIGVAIPLAVAGILI